MLASGGTGVLLVSPFNVEWGWYAQAEGVEVSEFCLFLVVFPARCISSISPRFYFRKHAFCFLPIVAILESSSPTFLNTETSLMWLLISCGLIFQRSMPRLMFRTDHRYVLSEMKFIR
jgi:hypothetical protein